MAREPMTIEHRDASGKSPVARRLRSTGRVPGVLYRPDGNISFSVDNLEAAAILRRGATLIDAKVDGTSHLSVVKEYQLHPVRGSLVHIDLQSVSMDQTVRTTASLTLIGTAPGLKEGGILQQGTREVLIESSASNIPDTIELDITSLGAGDVIILKDVPAPDGVTFLDDEGQMVAAITMPRGAKSKKADGSDADSGSEGDADSEGGAAE